MSQLNESMANQDIGRSPSLCVAWRCAVSRERLARAV